MFKRIKFALEGRSPKWAKVRREFLDNHPCCAACGTIYKLEVHHKIPFHIDKTLELDENNLITLCKYCHLVLGHLMDYDLYNKYLTKTIFYFKEFRSLASKKCYFRIVDK